MLKRTLSLTALLLAALVGFQSSGQAKTITYDGKGNEEWKKTARAGDVLVIPDGTYDNLKLTIFGKGKPKKPVRLKAETPGGVILTGESWIYYYGQYVSVDGFDLQNIKASTLKGKLRAPISNMRPGGSTEKSKDMCKMCILQHIRIDNEHKDSWDKDYRWVDIAGYYNIVRHNYFGAKKSQGRVLQLNIKHADIERQPVNHRIQYNYFASRNQGDALDNGGEALLIGESSRQHVSAQARVEMNLFYDASVAGEPEVISNKSSDNLYQFNTIRNTSASLTLRHGDRNTVQYNWFLQDQAPGSGGVRVIGKDNVVVNNYVDGAAGAQGEPEGKTYRTALGMAAGYSQKDDEANINGYQLSVNNVFDRNTVVRSVQPVMLSAWYKRDQDMTRPPQDTTFTNNLVMQMGFKPLDEYWTAGQSISVDFTPESDYTNKKGRPNVAEYYPSFKAVSGNISDWSVSKLVKDGVTMARDVKLKGCDAFGTGDELFDAYNGAGADLSLMAEPLLWTPELKSGKLGPVWLNANWNDAPRGYSPCS
ncbi:polysaccharide lyase 6 family protein [Neiella marina]|uniref:Polysaccharide lyase 6 family protein n=1 Tax=Neiella holothuriorum TaxID=2870530 RepID=A0ABS7EDQ2_9GAMM|nr:polysaccharide lyase 6 family protein [Neiella holothuriorum]MBW8190452.1 polysaccharide lyase 6 family protein [Neiella holothuriorum]